jgi:hypothetical protein
VAGLALSSRALAGLTCRERVGDSDVRLRGASIGVRQLRVAAARQG